MFEWFTTTTAVNHTNWIWYIQLVFRLDNYSTFLSVSISVTCEYFTDMNSEVPCLLDGERPFSPSLEGASSAATAQARAQGNPPATHRPALQASRAGTTCKAITPSDRRAQPLQGICLLSFRFLFLFLNVLQCIFACVLFGVWLYL